jgi:hypothetical protein
MSERDRHLAPCPGCHRHVMTDEAACPFCAAPLPVRAGEPPRAAPRGRLSRAALVAAGASATLIGGCSQSIMPPYGLPPIPDSGSMSDTADASPDGDGGGAAGRGGAGGADTGGGGAGGRPDAGSIVPFYGAPSPGDGG